MYLPGSCSYQGLSLGMGLNEGSKPIKQPMGCWGRTSVAHCGLQGAEPVLTLKNYQRTVPQRMEYLDYEVVSSPPPVEDGVLN